MNSYMPVGPVIVVATTFLLLSSNEIDTFASGVPSISFTLPEIFPVLSIGGDEDADGLSELDCD